MVPRALAIVTRSTSCDSLKSRVILSKMASLEEISMELSKLSQELSSMTLDHSEIDFYIYRLELIWKTLFHVHFDTSRNNMDDGDSILNYIRQAIWSLEQCNDMLDLSY